MRNGLALRPQSGRPPLAVITATAAIALSVFFLILWVYLVNRHEQVSGYQLGRQEEKQRESERLAAAIERAGELRDRWRVWAQKHQGILRRMRAGDSAALNQAWEAIPALLMNATESGLTNNDLISGPITFSWQPGTKASLRPVQSAVKQAQITRERQFIERRLRTMGAKHHDIEVARSMNGGPASVTLWASGRVTRTTMVEQQIPGQPVFVEGTPEEVHPPYHFLK